MKGNFSAPPMSPEILLLSKKIEKKVDLLSGKEISQKQLRLQFSSRVKTIQASLQIEGNSLSEEQVAAVLEGKTVQAPLDVLLEVKNALNAYEQLDILQPNLLDDFLIAHALLMHGLIEDAGRFRQKAAGISRGNQIIHAAPPADRVPA